MRDVGETDTCHEGRAHSWKDQGGDAWACTVCGKAVKVERRRTLSRLYLGSMCDGDLSPPPWARDVDD